MNKENFKERLKASIIRTIVAVLTIMLGVSLGSMAFYLSKCYFTNTDFEIVATALMYVASMLATIYGVYLISPIYIGLLIHNLSNCFLNEIRLNPLDEQDEEDEIEEEEKFQKKHIELKKEFLW